MDNTQNNTNNIKNDKNDTNINIKNDKNDKQLCRDKCYQLHPPMYLDSLRNYYEDIDRINCLKICDIHDIKK